MSNLHFDFEWIDPDGARGRELRATWARLRILVGDKVVSKVLDGKVKSVREHLFLPLYPIAEWIAYNWWPLLYEARYRSRSTFRTYQTRHNLQFGREGFYFPSLNLLPVHYGRIRAEWRMKLDRHGRLDFTESGEEVLDSEQVTEELRNLVEAVISRLREHDIGDAPLIDEWSAIQAASDDAQVFCRIVGMMGEDPYAITESDAARIIETAENVPAELIDDFFSVAELNGLQETKRALDQALATVRGQGGDLKKLKELRTAIQEGSKDNVMPWDRGYDVARQLRDLLGIGNSLIASDEELKQILQINGDAWIDGANGVRYFDAVTDVNEKDSPGFVVQVPHVLSKRFALCRAIYEYLSVVGEQTAIVSRAITERQKCNRAFAAEFLAPAGAIRDRIQGDSVDEDDVAELARKFGVSTWVIGHQINNQLRDVTIDYFLPEFGENRGL